MTARKVYKFLDPMLDRQVDELVREVNQLSGLTCVITTLKLTPGGSDGSMTFTNGRLTAQVQAT